MGLSSTDKKTLRFLLRALLGLLVVALIFAVIYFPFLGRFMDIIGIGSKGPYDFPGSVWLSEDPEIRLEVAMSRNGSRSPCYILVDGEKKPISIAAEPDRPWVFITPADNSGETLMLGLMKGCSKKSVTFVVTEDNLFGGEYENKEITLVRQK